MAVVHANASSNVETSRYVGWPLPRCNGDTGGRIMRRFFSASYTILANTQIKRTLRRSVRHQIRTGYQRRLKVEGLEDRRMLAVGTFFRADGSIGVDLDAYAVNSEAGMFAEQSDSGDGPQTYAHAKTIATVDGDGGFGFIEYDGEALSLPSIGAGLSAPFINAKLTEKVRVSGDVSGGWVQAYGYGSAGGSSRIIYQADPNFNEDLQLHGHLFLGAHGGILNSEFATVDPQHGQNVNVRIGNAYISAQYGFDSWSYSGFIPGFPNDGQVSGTSSGMQLNLHFHFVTSTFDQEELVISASVGADSIGGASGGGGASSLANMVGGAWVYVTGVGSDLTPGDFNADGNVDSLDFDIWADGDPRADVAPVTNLGGGASTFDGKVDALDYAVWAANADAILVSTNSDHNNGNYSYGDLSLREAIALAGDANHPGKDIIAFDGSLLGSTITLNPVLSYLFINGSNEVEILGPGADQLTINANGLKHHFDVTGGGATAIESTISHLKLTGAIGPYNDGFAISHSDSNGNHDLVLDSLEIVGNASGVRHGSNGQLSIRDSIVANHGAYGIASSRSAAAADASVTISNTTISDNGYYGLSIRDSDASISNSEISGNGPPLLFSSSYNPSNLLTITDSTIAENTHGIRIGTNAIANISNSTISTNNGLGIWVKNGTATLTNATVTQNRVATSGSTAGIYADTGGTVTLHNTIVAHNFSGPAGSEVAADLGRNTSSTPGSFSVGITSFNMIGVEGNSGISSANNNIILGATGDPGLKPLDYYGGKTRTHALLLTSLAVDAGDNSRATAIGLQYDQRGKDFDRVVDRDGTPDAGFDIDIGAFELALGELYA